MTGNLWNLLPTSDPVTKIGNLAYREALTCDSGSGLIRKAEPYPDLL